MRKPHTPVAVATEPTVTRDTCGRWAVNWPDPTYRPDVVISPETLDQIIDHLNELAMRRLADHRQDET